MAKRQKTKVFSFQGFDNKHYRTTEQYAGAVNALFNRATMEIANAAAKGNYDPDKPFKLNDYPKTQKEVQSIINGLASNMTSVISNGSRKQWLFACQKNDEFLKSIIDTSKVKKKTLEKMQDRNLDALKSFQERKVNGMDLSQRVWKYVGQYKDQIEQGLDVGLGDGRSAQELSKDLRKNLQDPGRLFRRVRDKWGNLQLSKNAKAFHPGQGVYRSSYKNAMRLTRSEVNMAYREADWQRWQQLDFVVGFEIHVSERHSEWLEKVWNKSHPGKLEICDKMVGKYPKWFKFKGWHPQCMCYCTAILADEETFANQELSDLKSALKGTEYKKLTAKNAVTDVPQGFKDWVAENESKQDGWSSTPYFIKDNFANGILADGLKTIAPPQPIKPIKTEQQKADIQARWNTRVAGNKYNGILLEAESKYSNESPAISNFANYIKDMIQSGKPIAEIEKQIAKLNHKIEVKALWNERVENNTLSTLLVDVANAKAQFGLPAIQSVFNAVEAKLASWENLSLADQLKKLNFEIEWVEKNQKYNTWKVAQSAYKKRLEKVEYLIDKENVQTSITHALDFTKTTKSAKVKQLVTELNTLFNNDAPIAQLKQKSLMLNNEVAKLEAAKAARNAKKIGINSADLNNPDNYTQARKDAALWSKNPEDADKKVRGVLETVWQDATDHEKLSAYRYTAGSSYINEPLRGQSYVGQYLGKYDSKKDTDALTSIINKSSYNFDMWVQRGVGENGFKGLFGFDIKDISINNFKSIYGKIGIEKGFSSCGTSKGTGFDNKNVIYNIYCPRGTKMLYAEPYSDFGRGSGKTWNGKTKQKHFGHESEIILQRSTKFRIIKAEYKDGRYYLDLEVIGQL